LIDRRIYDRVTTLRSAFTSEVKSRDSHLDAAS